MSCKELIESLRKACDERKRVLWQDAEAQAAAAKADAARRLEQLRAEADRKRETMSGDSVSRAVADANSRSRIIALAAEKALSDRLYQAAVSSLSLLRNGGSPELFAALARELPPLAWQTARVNPEDLDLARKHFPGAGIEADAGITGGMDVAAQGGAVRVVNTLEKRLERAWVDMQPDLIRDAYREVNREGTSADSSGPGVPGGISSEQDTREAVAPDT
ncbi:MAG: hypothetical protein A2078_05380 [Nitrospirae bacterium GWC2_57_9]|nr:MAG: hypothetical protein A2078_05380 [Nitrospirae bacterium GWC2_57_9]